MNALQLYCNWLKLPIGFSLAICVVTGRSGGHRSCSAPG